MHPAETEIKARTALRAYRDAQAQALSNDELVEKATDAAETSEDRAIFRELIGRFVDLECERDELLRTQEGN